MNLDDVRRALERGDPRDVLARLLKAWRARRSPELAALVDVVSAKIDLPPIPPTHTDWDLVERAHDEADVPRLLDGLLHGPQLAALTIRIDRLAARPPDPRIGLALAKLANDPPAGQPPPFAPNALFRALHIHDDPRGRAHLSKHGGQESRRLEVLIHRYGQRRLPLSEISGEVAGLARPVATLPRWTRKPELREEDFVRAVYDDPDADGPRLVYADWLVDRRDPRGEVIQLQCRPGERDKLQPVPHPSSLGPLVGAASQAMSWMRRGFLSKLSLDAPDILTRPLIGEPILSTVETITARSLELVQHPIMRALRELEAVSLDQLAALADGPPTRIQKVVVGDRTGPRSVLDSDGRGLPMLEELVFTRAVPILELAAAPIFARARKLTFPVERKLAAYLPLAAGRTLVLQGNRVATRVITVTDDARAIHLRYPHDRLHDEPDITELAELAAQGRRLTVWTLPAGRVAIEPLVERQGWGEIRWER